MEAKTGQVQCHTATKSELCDLNRAVRVGEVGAAYLPWCWDNSATEQFRSYCCTLCTSRDEEPFIPLREAFQRP